MKHGLLVTLPVLMAFGVPPALDSQQGGPVLATAEVIAFVGVTDATRAKTFYQDKLGLRFASEEPGHALVFDAGGTMLRVSVVREVPPARYTVLGWKVGDVGAAVDALVAKGVTFERFPGFTQDARGVWTTPDGTRIAWFKDPDGNLLSLTQFARK
jgi:catechol 2,3-dioxygenase-like lactoylglutathione lyase family enzyme